jgi:hypothetical protein
LKFRRTDPPVFVLSGPGSITYFGIGVFSPALPERSPNRVQLMWEIFPHDIFSTNIESVGQIAYGTVPPGFSQSTPASGPPLPLAPLEPGKYYVFYLLTIGASHVMGAFEMKDGKTSRGVRSSFFVSSSRRRGKEYGLAVAETRILRSSH